MPRRVAVPLVPGGRRQHGVPPIHSGSKRLTAAQGSFALSGSASGNNQPFVVADFGPFSLSGPDTGVVYSRVLTSDYASIALSGQAATLTYSGAITPTYTLTAAQGSYLLYGDPGPLVTADTGSFAFAGQDATLTYLSSHSDTGMFALAGQAATLTYVPSGTKSLKDEVGGTLLDISGNGLQDES